MTVRRTLSSKPVTDKDVVDALNREVIPVVRELRDAVNAFTSVSLLFDADVVDDNDSYLECDGTFEVLLPTAVGRAGKQVVVKNVGTGTITLTTSNSETIDQHASGAVTLAQWVAKHLVSNGENWRII